MPKTTPPVQTPGENQAPANEPEQQAAAEAAQAEQTGGPRTEAEIVATMRHGDPAERAADGRWVVPPEHGTLTRPDGTRVTRLADGKIVES